VPFKIGFKSRCTCGEGAAAYTLSHPYSPPLHGTLTPPAYTLAASSPGTPLAEGGLRSSAGMRVVCAGLGGEPALPGGSAEL
jgi:hypothetical protein